SGYRQVPVTALEFATDTVLLASDGGSLCVYNTESGRQLGKKENVISFGRRIHGIRVHRQTSTPEMHRALVHGAKAWATVAVALDNSSSPCKQAHLRIERFEEEMEDWIMAAHWVYGSRGELLVALALAHNQVVVCDPQASGKGVVYRTRCAEQSILYSAAFHGDSVDALVVAAGTVFNQVVVWRVKSADKEEGKAAQIIHRLQGHAGVVFGVRFSSDGQHLASVSDDRTVVAWDLASPANPKRMFGHQARVWSCLILDSGILVSASEDGTCRVWDVGSGMAVDSWRQCKKNVWALAASPTGGSGAAAAAAAVASGGADGSIRLWDVHAALKRRVERPELLATVALPLQSTYTSQDEGHGKKMMHSGGDYARGFALVAEGDAEVLITDSGYVLLRSAGAWSTCFASDVLRGYSVTACAPAGDLVAVGMRDGSALLLFLLPGRLPEAQQIVARLHKSSVQCLILGSKSDGMFDMVSADASAAVWSVVDSVAGTCTKKAELVLPPGCQLASAAVDRARGWVAVGSASGGLYLFDLFDLHDPASEGAAAAAAAAAGRAQAASDVPAIAPCVCWARAHGKHRLSSVVFASDSSFSGGRASSARSCVVLTGGRDGLVQQFAVRIGNVDNTVMSEEQRPPPKAVQSVRSFDGSHKQAIMARIRSDRVTRGWVEQLVWAMPQRRLVAVTFHGKRLVALELGTTQFDAPHTLVVLLSLVCAGGSKPWQLLHTPQGVRVGVVMRSQLRTHTFASASSAPTHVLAPGGCATETRCVAVVCAGGAVVVAAGGDDGCVRFFHGIDRMEQEQQQQQQQQQLSAVQCHTSAIRCMRASGAYLFTGGSKCELRSWTVVAAAQPPLLVEHARAPPSPIADGARVMDVCVVHADADAAAVHVAAAYSDASIRLWRLDTQRRRFECVAYDAAHAHCVLSLASFCCHGGKDGRRRAWWLVSGATSGQLAFWNVTRFIAPPPCGLSSEEIGSSALGPPALLQEGAHQLGVNSIDAVAHNQCAKSIGGGGGGATLATGGDDGSVAVWEFFPSSLPLLVCLVARRANAHAAAVQHVALGKACVFSVGSDQRLAAWAVRESRLELLRMACTQVADPAAMALMPSSVVIVGMGTEVIHFLSD
ncbi:WD repeat-containing protein 6, partial [Coemansia erecta]